MNPFYFISTVCLSAAVAFGVGVSVGKRCQQDRQASAQIAQLHVDADKVDALRATEREQEATHNERIKIIRETPDACLAQPIPGPVLEQLRGAGIATGTRSATD